MSNKNVTIYLEPDEEITAVVDRLRHTSAERITLVVPKRAVVMQSIVNLRILARQAAQLDKIIAVVASDPGVRNMIARAGLLAKTRINDPFPTKKAAKAEAAELEEPEQPARRVTVHSGTKTTTIAVPEERRTVSAQEGIVDDSGADEPQIPRKIVWEDLPEPTERDKPLSAVESAVLKTKALQEKSKVPSPAQPEEDRTKQIEAIKRKAAGGPKSPWRKRIGLIIAGVVAVVVVGGAVAALYLLPRATILVVPVSETISADPEVTVQKDLDPEEVSEILVAGTVIEDQAETTATFDTSGKKTVGEKASGTVSFSNAFSSDPRVVPAGTKLSTSGVSYRLDSAVTIPGATVSGGSTVAGTTTGHATAEAIGSEYNQNNTALGIAGLSSAEAEKITANGSFSGGKTEEKRVVSDDDLKNATAKLTEDLTKELLTKLPVQAVITQKILSDAIETKVVASEPSLTVGEEGSSFSLKLTVSARTLGFDQDAVVAAAVQQLGSDLPVDKELISSQKEQNVALTTTLKDFDNGKMIVKVHVEKLAIAKLDLNQYADDLVGKNAGEVEQFFAKQSEIESVKVRFWPFWVRNVPQRSNRVDFALDV